MVGGRKLFNFTKLCNFSVGITIGFLDVVCCFLLITGGEGQDNEDGGDESDNVFHMSDDLDSFSQDFLFSDFSEFLSQLVET